MFAVRPLKVNPASALWRHPNWARSRTLMFVVNTFGREATTAAAAATERKG